MAGKRRDALLSRKGRIVVGIQNAIDAAPMPDADRVTADVITGAFELLLDVLIDIAHPQD